MVDDGVALEQIEVVEIELAAARQDEHAEEVRVPAHLLHELARHVERRVRDEVHDRIALIARAEQRQLRRELREDARRVAPALALEAEEVRGGELPGRERCTS